MDLSGLPPVLRKEGGIVTPFKPKIKRFKGHKKTRRYSEIHIATAQVIHILFLQNKIFPSTEEVWTELEKGRDDIECIQEITSTKIDWCSYRGVPQTMKRPTFNNIVSQFKTGKKRLHEYIKNHG